jgi:ABC-type molybdate transport system substrate-binding protein
MKAHKRKVSLVVVVCFWGYFHSTREIAVAAAADLKFAIGEIAGQYEKQTGNKVNVAYGPRIRAIL